MIVPSGFKRVLLVGGDRHGHWRDVPDKLPESIWVEHRPSRRAVSLTLVSDPSVLPEVPFDRYLRARVVGFDSSGATDLTVYATHDVIDDQSALDSAIHYAYCWGECPRPEDHERAASYRTTRP